MRDELSNSQRFQPLTIKDWHEWLVANSHKSREIWLVYTRHTIDKNAVDYEETVEEALCFGWIDGVIKRLDDEHYVRKFTPRNPGSKWSALNLTRAQRMVEQGRMTAQGMALFREGLTQNNQGRPTRREEQEEYRKEMEKLLTPETLDLYHMLPDSLQRQYAGWVMSGKREETRQKRIEELSNVLGRGERLGLK